MLKQKQSHHHKKSAIQLNKKPTSTTSTTKRFATITSIQLTGTNNSLQATRPLLYSKKRHENYNQKKSYNNNRNNNPFDQEDQRTRHNQDGNLTESFSNLSLNNNNNNNFNNNNRKLSFSLDQDPNNDSIPIDRPPRDYIDARDKPGYKERMADKSKGNTYNDLTLFGIQYGLPTGQSYSKQFRPKWVSDLTESFAQAQNIDIEDPDLEFPVIDTNAGATNMHMGLKVMMKYSSPINQKFNPLSLVKYKPTKSSKPNVALMMSYRGTGYQGLQIQFQNDQRSDAKTIEGDILDALVKSGHLSESNAKAPHKVKWSRAARTDKGVHAATNLLNAKLRIHHFESIPEAMFVKKKALRYASNRFSIVIPIAMASLTSLINSEGIVDEITVEEESADVENAEENDDDVKKPVVLSTTKSQLLSLLPTNIAVDLLGRVTISPDLIHTLKKFKIIQENDDEGIKKVLKNIETEGDKIEPAHQFTVWEQKLLHLVGQFGSEWDQTEKADEDDEDKEGGDNTKKAQGEGNAQNDQNGEKDENNAQNGENGQNGDEPTLITDVDPFKLSTSEQIKLLISRGHKESDLKGMSKRRREMLFSRGTNEKRDETRRKNENKIPYIRTHGWLDEHVAQLTNPDYFSDCLQTKLRKHLPTQFHLVRAVKVTSSFDAKLQASSRTYEYIVPSFAFMPISKYPADLFDKMMKLARTDTFQSTADKDMAVAIGTGPNMAPQQPIKASTEGLNSVDADNDGLMDFDLGEKNQHGKRHRPNDKKKNKNESNDGEDDVMEDGGDDEALTAAVNDLKNKGGFSIDELIPPKELLDFKLSPQDLVNIQFTLSHFLGTQSHHNFTSGKKASDASAKRFIRSFKPIGTFNVNNVEFVHLCVHGDSFLLHQIRKMVGFSMSLIRGNYDDIPLDCPKPLNPDERFVEKYSAAEAVQMMNSGVEKTTTNETTKTQATTTTPSASTPAASSLPAPSQNLVDTCSHAFGHVFSYKGRYNIPPAPALGLLLDHVHYDTHDFKTAKSIPMATKGGNWSHLRETIYSNYHRAVPLIHQIKQREIYKEIAVQELKINNAWRWLHLLNLLDFHSAKLDEFGRPLVKNRVNHNLIKGAHDFSIIDVHGSNNNTRTLDANDIANGVGDNSGYYNDEDDNDDKNGTKKANTNKNGTPAFGVDMQYVQLDSTTTAAIPNFDHQSNNNHTKQ